MKNKKLKLEDLKVQSFITTSTKENKTIAGGGDSDLAAAAFSNCCDYSRCNTWCGSCEGDDCSDNKDCSYKIPCWSTEGGTPCDEIRKK